MDIILKTGIFAGLQVVTNPDKNEVILTVGNFTLAELIYDIFKDYRMLPFDKLVEYQNYIFTVLFQTLFNQIFYPDNIKKLIMDALLSIIAIASADIINSPN